MELGHSVWRHRSRHCRGFFWQISCVLKEINVNLIHWKTDRLWGTAMHSNNKAKLCAPAESEAENSPKLLWRQRQQLVNPVWGALDTWFNIGKHQLSNIFNIESNFFLNWRVGSWKKMNTEPLLPLFSEFSVTSFFQVSRVNIVHFHSVQKTEAWYSCRSCCFVSHRA